MGGGAQDADVTAGMLDHREDIHAGPGERDDLEEVSREDRLGLGAQEHSPVSEVRCGAGSTPASRRISQTVDAATFTPNTSSSPWTRRYPQELFSRARRSTNLRMDRTVRGRPARLGREATAWR
jgi:hypothetical protein